VGDLLLGFVYISAKLSVGLKALSRSEVWRTATMPRPHIDKT